MVSVQNEDVNPVPEIEHLETWMMFWEMITLSLFMDGLLLDSLYITRTTTVHPSCLYLPRSLLTVSSNK